MGFGRSSTHLAALRVIESSDEVKPDEILVAVTRHKRGLSIREAGYDALMAERGEESGVAE